MANINLILCPVDLSDFLRNTLHHALALATWYHAQSIKRRDTWS